MWNQWGQGGSESKRWRCSYRQRSSCSQNPPLPMRDLRARGVEDFRQFSEAKYLPVIHNACEENLDGKMLSKVRLLLCTHCSNFHLVPHLLCIKWGQQIPLFPATTLFLLLRELESRHPMNASRRYTARSTGTARATRECTLGDDYPQVRQVVYQLR